MLDFLRFASVACILIGRDGEYEKACEDFGLGVQWPLLVSGFVVVFRKWLVSDSVNSSMYIIRLAARRQCPALLLRFELWAKSIVLGFKEPFVYISVMLRGLWSATAELIVCAHFNTLGFYCEFPIPSWNMPYLQPLISESSPYNPAKYVNSAVCLESNSRTLDYALKLNKQCSREVLLREHALAMHLTAVISHFWVKQQYWAGNMGWSMYIKNFYFDKWSFVHLADTFIQSDFELHWRYTINLFMQSPGIKPITLSFLASCMGVMKVHVNALSTCNNVNA